MFNKYIQILFHKLLFCGINHKYQWSTLEQDNNAPEMPICLTNLIEPKRHWADPSKTKLYVCSIRNIKIYLAVVDWNQRVNSSPYFTNCCLRIYCVITHAIIPFTIIYKTPHLDAIFAWTIRLFSWPITESQRLARLYLTLPNLT
jgi:hypothetical protein